MRDIDANVIGEALRTNITEPLLDEALLERSGMTNGFTVFLTTDTGEMQLTIIARADKRAIPIRMSFDEAGEFANNLLSVCAAFLVARSLK